MSKTVKFGGSSLSGAEHFTQALDIIRAERDRRYCVPSAPGKRFSGDDKVTDLLYAYHASPTEELLQKIAARYSLIIEGLGLRVDLGAEFDAIRARVAQGCPVDYTASRGEYLNAIIMADALKCEFVDAADVIFFTADGRVDDARTGKALRERLLPLSRAVIPGFYGTGEDGEVHTFSRGGSDITGALVAEATHSDIYENWTDVPGVMAADPRVVIGAQSIPVITYAELRELSYMGATVLHEDAIFPARRCGIPIHILSTLDPSLPGTRIVAQAPHSASSGQITGIAGRKGVVTFTLEKAMMNTELGFARKVLAVFENEGISIEHMPTGIDTLSVMVTSIGVGARAQKITEALKAAVEPDSVEVIDHLALIAIVGRGMVKSTGVAAKVFSALAACDVNIRMIDQGSSELNIIIGIEESAFERAMKAIYKAFYI